MIAIVGDLHGNSESLYLITASLGLTDSNLDWAAQNCSLIITGDACDRGYDSASIYKHMIKWQAQAPRLDSEVIFLIGNHEIMNIQGQLYYNTYEETASYGDGKSDGFIEKQQAFAAGGWLYEWLAEQPFIIARGPFIIAHADFPAAYRNLTVKEIDKLSRRIFSGSGALFSEPDPLLWSRKAGLMPDYEEALKDFLEQNNARSWVCGHTPSVSRRMRRLFDNRYICVDTAMMLGPENTSVLVFESDALQAVYYDARGGSRIETLTL